MASTNDLKNGLVLNIDGQLWTVIEFQHVKPGKGPAFVRTKLKSVLSGKVVDKTFNAGIKVETASVDRRDMQYLYRDGDDWVITGNKYWCTFADGADYIIVFARTTEAVDPKRRHAGISAFLIEKPRGELPPGVKGSPIPKIGYFGWTTWELAFDGCRVPATSLLGEEGKGFYLATHELERARAHTAARAVGLARGALEDATKYALEREQFGRPIGEFQAIRFKLASMATDIEAARQLTYYVCDEIDSGRRCDKQASMAKLFASEMAERVTSEAIQIFGGAGYTTLNAVERYWRDARLTKIFEGTSEIQMRIISDQLLGKSRT